MSSEASKGSIHCQVFNQSAKMLVISNMARQSSIRPEFPDMSSKAWALEFCTVRLSAGRRSGSSYTALDLARNVFKAPVIVTMSETQKRMMEKSLQEAQDREKISEIRTIPVYYIGDLVGYSPEDDCDGVIVDCASVIERTSNSLDYLYTYIFSHHAKTRDFCFVLLG